MKKQFIAKLLVLAMVLAMVPATFLAVFAEEGDTGNDTQENKAYYSVDGDTTTRLPDEVDAANIEAEVVGVTASVSLGDKAVASLAEQVKDKQLVINVGAEGATTVNISFAAKALSELAEETGADMTIVTPVATIEIPNAALTSEVGAVGILKISVKANDSGVSFSIQAGGEVKDLTGLKISF